MSAPVEYLPILVSSGVVTDWERGFCASLIDQQRRGRELSDKQAATLQRIVDKFNAEMRDWHQRFTPPTDDAVTE